MKLCFQENNTTKCETLVASCDYEKLCNGISALSGIYTCPGLATWELFSFVLQPWKLHHSFNANLLEGIGFSI